MPTVLPPARTELSNTYPNPKNAVARIGLGKLWDWATNLLGTSGTPAAARAALGITAIIGDGTGTPLNRRRNPNGDNRIDQLNAGAAVTLSSGAAGYPVDGCNCDNIGGTGTFTAQQIAVTDLPGFTNALRFKTTVADAAPGAGVVYRAQFGVEGYDLADFSLGTAGAKAIATGGKVKCAVTGTFSGAFSNVDGSRSYPFTYTIAVANTWQDLVVVAAGDTSGTWNSTNGVGLRLALDIGSGSNYQGAAGAWVGSTKISATGATKLINTLNATLDITGLQIEKGTVTPYEYKEFQRELSWCQRYFETSYDLGIVPGTVSDNCVGGAGVASDSSFVVATCPFKAAKRIIPSTIIYAYDGTAGAVSLHNVTGHTGATGVTHSKSGMTGFTGIRNTNTGFTPGAFYWWHWTASSRLI